MGTNSLLSTSIHLEGKGAKNGRTGPNAARESGTLWWQAITGLVRRGVPTQSSLGGSTACSTLHDGFEGSNRSSQHRSFFSSSFAVMQTINLHDGMGGLERVSCIKQSALIHNQCPASMSDLHSSATMHPVTSTASWEGVKDRQCVSHTMVADDSVDHPQQHSCFHSSTLSHHAQVFTAETGDPHTLWSGSTRRRA